MRRRQRRDSEAPDRLLTYRPEDWPGACHPECAFWEAVEAWQAEHPGADLALEGAPDLPWHPERI